MMSSIGAILKDLKARHNRDLAQLRAELCADYKALCAELRADHQVLRAELWAQLTFIEEQMQAQVEGAIHAVVEDIQLPREDDDDLAAFRSHLLTSLLQAVRNATSQIVYRICGRGLPTDKDKSLPTG